jgi:glycine hydroxymethyltransferase
MMVVNTVQSFGIDGTEAEHTLDRVAITCNKQIIPDDPNPPLRPSGIRLGTPAATTRGFKEAEMKRLAGWIVRALRDRANDAAIAQIKREVEELCHEYSVPGIVETVKAGA